ncbi:MAG: hypothetical protein MI975_13495 [Cytophagales bacterium]|nr:hypothetical protein [Cytophagales bacterium]
MKRLIFNLIVSGIALGTAWAIRGQFGHEQGAAWAGAIGALCIILISKREDWYNKVFKATLAAAIGWGLGGMMSYGKVVGFGRGTDFINVYYGLLMLFVIGGLYGFLGGGLFGLTLSESKERKVNWPLLLTGMTSGGIIAYFFIVIQWEWLMTPPRSEVWAVCLGMAIFLAWFLAHFKNPSALRVAVFAGLGGGFGFAFGNFLQVLGNAAEIRFNFWNVMEYSLGFFGGAGMAYGTFTSDWNVEDKPQKKSGNFIPILLVVLFFPFVVWDQSFSLENLQKTYEKLVSENLGIIALVVQCIAFALIVIQTAFVLLKYHFQRKDRLTEYAYEDVKALFISYFGVYTIFSLLITGAILSTYRIEQYLYIVNFGIILLILPKLRPVFLSKKVNAEKWGAHFLFMFLIIAVLALIAINIHGEMPGAQIRFEF